MLLYNILQSETRKFDKYIHNITVLGILNRCKMSNYSYLIVAYFDYNERISIILNFVGVKIKNKNRR